MFCRIHPRDKLTVSNRLSWSSLMNVYKVNKTGRSSGPYVVNIKQKQNQLILTYDQTIIVHKVTAFTVSQLILTYDQTIIVHKVTAFTLSQIILTYDQTINHHSSCIHCFYWKSHTCIYLIYFLYITSSVHC